MSAPDTSRALSWFDICNAIAAAALTLLSIALAFDLGSALGIIYYQEQVFALAVGLSLFLFFHRRPRVEAGRHSATRLRQHGEAALAWALLVLCAGFAWRFEDYSAAIVTLPIEIVLGGALVLLALLEAVRRIAGLSLVIVVVAIFAYALSNGILPAAYAPAPLTVSEAVTYLVVDVNSILGAPVAVALYVVIPFILLGEVLRQSGGSAFFTDVATGLVGRSTGGSAKIAVVSSALFGSISGSAVANVATSGIITIPLMKESGYTARQAGAIEAVASTGGQLLPPVMGATAFLMAEFLQIPYGEVVLAALIPAALYYIAVFFATHLIARREGIRGLAAIDQSPGSVLARGWFFLVGLLVLLGLLIQGAFRPEAVALLVAAFFGLCGLFLGYGETRLTLRVLARCLPVAGRVSMQILLISAIAGAVIGLLNISGLSFTLSMFLIKLSGGSVVALLLLTALASIILGMGMPTTGVYVLLATVIAPALVKLGIAPLAAHMFIFYFGMLSMVTPPVAMAAFAGATISGSPPMRTALLAMMLSWPAFVTPFLFVHSPALLFEGTWIQIVEEGAFALIGILAVTASVLAYWTRSLHVVERTLLLVLGVFVLLFGHQGETAAVLMRAFAAAAIIVIALDLLPRLVTRRTAKAAPPEA